MSDKHELRELLSMPLESAVAEYVARELTHESRLLKLNDESAPIIYEALPMAELLRGRTDVDPADAFLEGVTYSELARQEVKDRLAFANTMTASDEEKMKKPHRFRTWLVGSAAVVFANGKIIARDRTASKEDLLA